MKESTLYLICNANNVILNLKLLYYKRTNFHIQKSKAFSKAYSLSILF